MNNISSTIRNGINAYANIKHTHPRVVGTTVTLASAAATYAVPTYLVSNEFSPFVHYTRVGVWGFTTGLLLSTAPQIRPMGRIRTEALTAAYLVGRGIGIMGRVGIISLKSAGQAYYTALTTSVCAGGLLGSAKLALYSFGELFASYPDLKLMALYGGASLVTTGAACLFGRAAIKVATTGFVPAEVSPMEHQPGYQYSFDGRMKPKNPNHCKELSALRIKSIRRNLVDLKYVLKRLPSDLRKARQKIIENGERTDAQSLGPSRSTPPQSPQPPALQS